MSHRRPHDTQRVGIDVRFTDQRLHLMAQWGLWRATDALSSADFADTCPARLHASCFGEDPLHDRRASRPPPVGHALGSTAHPTEPLLMADRPLQALTHHDTSRTDRFGLSLTA